jgi:oligosaccharide repeat unit polymerase
MDSMAETPRIPRYILVALAACAVFLAIGAGNTMSLFMQDAGQWQSRGEYYASGGATAFGSSRLGLLRDILVKPVLFAILAIAAVRIILRPRWGNAALFAAVSILHIVYDLTFLGRGQTVNVIVLVALVVAFGGRFQGQQRLSLSLRTAKVIGVTLVALLFVAVGFIVAMSIMKSGGSLGELPNVLTRYFTYWMLSFTLFDQRDVLLVPGDCFCYTLGGFYDLVILIGRRFGAENLLPGRSMDLQAYLPIGSDRVGNAFHTWCIAFYSDMGALGVSLLPFCFGAIVGWAFRRYVQMSSPSHFVLLVYLYGLTLMGVLEWQLSWNENAACLILLLVLCTVRRKPAASSVPKDDPPGLGRETGLMTGLSVSTGVDVASSCIRRCP